MAENTNIEWCDATVNWWVGCTQVSPGCDHCYAKRIAAPFWGQKWGPGVSLQRFDGALETLKALDRKAQRLGRPLVVFHNSVSDMGDKDAPDEWRAAAFQGMADTPNLIHLVLTKRIGNLCQYLQRDKLAADLIHAGRVWLGITVCNQEEADRDIIKLIHVPALHRFLSLEPLLARVDLWNVRDFNGHLYSPISTSSIVNPYQQRIDWVIAGGESGPCARPMHPDWVRLLRDQCRAREVPFMFKQWGEFDLSYDRERDDPDCRQCNRVDKQPGRWINLAGGHGFNGERVHYAHKVGKKAAGRLLDGRTWDEVPS